MAASRTGVVGVLSDVDVTCVLSFTSAFPTQRRWVMIKANFQPKIGLKQPNALTQRSQPSIWVEKTTQRFLECTGCIFYSAYVFYCMQKSYFYFSPACLTFACTLGCVCMSLNFSPTVFLDVAAKSVLFLQMSLSAHNKMVLRTFANSKPVVSF